MIVHNVLSCSYNYSLAADVNKQLLCKQTA